MTKAEREKLVEQYVATLDLSIEEAEQLIDDDLKVDKMTQKELNADLTTEQKKATKSAKNVGTKAPTEKKPREKKADYDKSNLVECLRQALVTEGAEVKVTNAEREIELTFNGRKFKVVLSAPRS